MTDNIKLHPRLGYSVNFGCIIGSTFLLEQTHIENYNEVKLIIQNIISNNAIAKQVYLYLLQVTADIVVNSNLIDICDDNIEKDLRDAYLELSFLLSDTTSLNSQDLESNENFDTGVTKSGTLNIFIWLIYEEIMKPIIVNIWSKKQFVKLNNLIIQI
ncbi:11981_t:CDS:2 [Racocetra fulgida]|uniref:11981_t:CDS:1 n=1 Tax=Racocetra fulgida TaxID=60492 RepID=A0A9N8WKW1_9GLOM|nr:11981_t:CDS:2 [Racocetra fulgida]